MRTTLDIDDTVLAAAKSLARSKGISLGRAVSELALRGLVPAEERSGPTSVDLAYSPFPLIHGDVVVIDDLIAEHRDE